MTILQTIIMLCIADATTGYGYLKREDFKKCVAYFEACPLAEAYATDERRLALCIKEWK